MDYWYGGVFLFLSARPDMIPFQLYRFWMFFSRNGWYLVILPCLMFLASVGASSHLVGPLVSKVTSKFYSPFAHPHRHALRSRNYPLVYNQHQPRYSVLGHFHCIERHHHRMYRNSTPLHEIPDAQSNGGIWLRVYLRHFNDGGIRSALYCQRLDFPSELRCQQPNSKPCIACVGTDPGAPIEPSNVRSLPNL